MMKLLLILGVLIVLGAGAYFWSGKTPSYAPSTQVSEIKTASDLNTAEKELNSEDLNALDKDLNQLNQDSSGF